MPPLTDALRQQRAALSAQLANSLAAGDTPLADLRDLRDRLAMLDGALAALAANAPRRWMPLLWPIAAVAAVLSIAVGVSVPVVPLSLDLQSTAVTLVLAEASTLSPVVVAGELRIEGFSTLESADDSLVRAAKAESADRVAVRADELRLRSLQLPAGARLTLRARAGTTELQVESERPPVVADIELRGRTALLLNDAAQALERRFDHGEWLRLVSGDTTRPTQSPPPLLLTLARPGESVLRWADLRPQALQFTERRASAGAGADAVAAVGSSIEAGRLTLPATGETLQLSAGDGLALDGLVVERFEVVAGATLALKLTGSARRLEWRTGEFSRSLKPSLLEYAARHHLVKLLWGSAAVLWGALAWIRQQVGGWVR